MMYVLQMVTSLAFWISISSTEGWKWRMDDGTPDNSRVITANTYHLWRALTTLAFGCSAFTYVSVPSFIVSNMVAWLCYERWMSLVQYGSLLYRRPVFHVVGKAWLNRPRPMVEIWTAGACLVIYTIVAALGA